ncbi:MAG TPA: DUF4169 family protein [Rhizomicrobium sp.]|mgnify:CR=1 FL=1|jgi:hypothetical protein|nr:DUF4169 family protein [Rhizomicrobium sp.]
MADPINLRAHRKKKARAEREKTAEANRVLHGTPKAVRKLEEARRKAAQNRLAQHRLDGKDAEKDADK